MFQSHVFSYYAPTYAATREEGTSSFDTIQSALSGIPPQECYVMLGDFNARVGSRRSEDDERGPHGHGILNEARRESFFGGSTVFP